MKYYVGLDVSLKEISVCVIDGDGKIKARGTTPADPMAVKSWFKKSLTRAGNYCS
jgi:transposase